VGVPSARYSLVKGERIVRSVLSTRFDEWSACDNGPCTDWNVMPSPMLVGYEAGGNHVRLAPQL
jgi:hypothetical protein